MTDDIHSIARRIEALHAERDALGEDIAEAFKDAKKAKLDLPALRHALAERRRRDKSPAAYEALKGRAGELLEILDTGLIVEHARAPARARGTDRAGTDDGAPVGGSGRVAPAAPPDAIPTCVAHTFGRTPGRRLLTCLDCGAPYEESAANSEAPSGATAAPAGSEAVTAPPAASDTPSSAVVASIPEPLPRSDVEASPPAALNTPVTTEEITPAPYSHNDLSAKQAPEEIAPDHGWERQDSAGNYAVALEVLAERAWAAKAAPGSIPQDAGPIPSFLDRRRA